MGGGALTKSVMDKAELTCRELTDHVELHVVASLEEGTTRKPSAAAGRTRRGRSIWLGGSNGSL